MSFKTKLQFVIESCWGPPDKQGGSPGESYWVCQFHGDTSPSFHTMPSKPEYKDRWNCFGCGKRGDEADFLKELFPEEDWPTRRARLDALRHEWEEQQGQDSDAIVSTYSSSLRGARSHRQDAPEKVASVFNDLQLHFKHEEEQVFLRLQTVQDYCKAGGVSMESLVDYWREKCPRRQSYSEAIVEVWLGLQVDLPPLAYFLDKARDDNHAVYRIIDFVYRYCRDGKISVDDLADCWRHHELHRPEKLIAAELEQKYGNWMAWPEAESNRYFLAVCQRAFDQMQ